MSLDGALKSLIGQLPTRAISFARKTADGWTNVLTGLGSSMVDKVRHTQPAPYWALPDSVLADLFHSDSTVRKIVTKRPDDSLRHGIRVSIPEEAGGHETATKIQDAMDDLDFVGKVREACYWERLFGGAVLYIAVDDGQYAIDSQALPIREETLRKILWVKAIDRTRIRPSYVLEDLDPDPESLTYGEPLYYLIALDLDTGAQVRVHRSRLLIFPGAVTTAYEKRGRGGWGVSVIDPVYEALQRNASAWASAAGALANAQYVIYKLRGLANMFSRPQGEEQAKSRARSMEMAKSMINAVLIDAEDDYVRENPNFGNMPQMLEMQMLDVCAASDTPATVLWGRSPAGLNATGESDIELWHGSCTAYQEHNLRPRAQYFVTLLMKCKEGPTRGVVADGWRVYFPPLREMSDLEKADVRLKTAQADASDIDKGVLLPQEVAVSRFRPEGYSITTHIDLDLREKMLKLEIDQRETEMKEGRAPGMTPEEPPPLPPGTPANSNGQKPQKPQKPQGKVA